MKIIKFDSIDSTNSYLKTHENEYENFTFVFSKFQTSGKGRENRTWFSEANKNLIFSYLIKDKNLISKYKAISLGTATLVARFLEKFKNFDVQIKWPNDIYVEGKKICGVLLEGNLPNYLVVGVGLNVNQTNFNDEYRTPPTSIKLISKKDSDLDKLSEDISNFIVKHIVKKDFEKKTYDFVCSHNYLLNKKVKVNNVSGVVTGVDKNFNILIDDKPVESREIDIL